MNSPLAGWSPAYELIVAQKKPNSCIPTNSTNNHPLLQLPTRAIQSNPSAKSLISPGFKTEKSGCDSPEASSLLN